VVIKRDGVTSRVTGRGHPKTFVARTVSPCRAGHGSSVTISKDKLADIVRSGYPEKAGEDPPRAPKRPACLSGLDRNG
jgi:hypothetical protein